MADQAMPPEEWLQLITQERKSCNGPNKYKFWIRLYRRAIASIPVEESGHNNPAYAKILVDYAKLQALTNEDEARSIFQAAKNTVKHCSLIYVAWAQFELLHDNPTKCKKLLNKGKERNAQPAYLLDIALENFASGNTQLIDEETEEHTFTELIFNRSITKSETYTFSSHSRVSREGSDSSLDGSPEKALEQLCASQPVQVCGNTEHEKTYLKNSKVTSDVQPHPNTTSNQDRQQSGLPTVLPSNPITMTSGSTLSSTSSDDSTSDMMVNRNHRMRKHGRGPCNVSKPMTTPRVKPHPVLSAASMTTNSKAISDAPDRPYPNIDSTHQPYPNIDSTQPDKQEPVKHVSLSSNPKTTTLSSSSSDDSTTHRLMAKTHRTVNDGDTVPKPMTTPPNVKPRPVTSADSTAATKTLELNTSSRIFKPLPFIGLPRRASKQQKQLIDTPEKIDHKPLKVGSDNQACKENMERNVPIENIDAVDSDIPKQSHQKQQQQQQKQQQQQRQKQQQQQKQQLQLQQHQQYQQPRQPANDPVAPVNQQSRQPAHDPVAPVNQQSRQPAHDPVAPVNQQSRQPAYDPVAPVNQQSRQPAHDLVAPVNQQSRQPAHDPVAPVNQQSRQPAYDHVAPVNQQSRQPAHDPVAPVNQQSRQPAYDPVAPVNQQSRQPAHDPVAPVNQQSRQPAYDPVAPVNQQSRQPAHDLVAPVNQQSRQPAHDPVAPVNQQSRQPAYDHVAPVNQQSRQPAHDLVASVNQQSRQPAYDPVAPVNQQHQRQQRGQHCSRGESRPRATDSRTASAVASVPSKEILVVNGRMYNKLSVIGKGGSSVVYRVFMTDHVYAIKYVDVRNADATVIQSYINEITLLKRLQGHDSIIKLHDWEMNESEHVIKLVLECGSIDLAGYLRKNHQRITIDYIKFWKQMLDAVQVVHDEGIVHSDLKPANFLLVEGNLKLIDFGIANAIQDDSTSFLRDTQIGTLNYMAPESLRDISQAPGSGEHHRPVMKIGRASDVWALGCILYLMVYGKTPFQHIGNHFQKWQCIMDPNHEIKFPAIDNNDLVDTMKGCLKRNHRERYTIPELKNHPFLTRKASDKVQFAGINCLVEDVENVMNHIIELKEVHTPNTLRTITQNMLQQLSSRGTLDFSSVPRQFEQPCVEKQPESASQSRHPLHQNPSTNGSALYEKRKNNKHFAASLETDKENVIPGEQMR